MRALRTAAAPNAGRSRRRQRPRQKSRQTSIAALALFGIIAALFGPVKYSMLPDQLELGELATGNALVEGATFMAILLGTVAGGQFVAGSAHMGWVASAVVVLALLSWAFASRIPATTPSAPDLSVNANPWTSTVGLSLIHI